ncbi:helix-turn-helix domain-containing protein [Streptomyces polygonati]|uniref:Helix-turn-helix domain-containing protein n=1 Tax=Streptomyces polygonati TaxID=1617087 RepID=A0ABV8HMK9_9ACTN
MAASEPADESARSVIGTAFALLESLRRSGPARVSDLQRDCALPRTTVHRLLGQLEAVGAVRRADGRWHIGPTLKDLGSEARAEVRLREAARRPLVNLARATGALVAISVEAPGHGLVLDVLPGARPLDRGEPRPGMVLRTDGRSAGGLDASRTAWARAQRRARHGDLRPVLDIGQVDPAVTCVAVPLRLSSHDTAAVWVMFPSGGGILDTTVTATRRTAQRIAAALAGAGPRTDPGTSALPAAGPDSY